MFLYFIHFSSYNALTAKRWNEAPHRLNLLIQGDVDLDQHIKFLYFLISMFHFICYIHIILLVLLTSLYLDKIMAIITIVNFHLNSINCRTCCAHISILHSRTWIGLCQMYVSQIYTSTNMMTCCYSTPNISKVHIFVILNHFRRWWMICFLILMSQYAYDLKEIKA